MDVAVDFYHCTRTPLLDVAVRLAAKAYDSGQRLLVLAAAELLTELDNLLWTLQPESFLPHGIAGAAEDRAQPILLTSDSAAIGAPANRATLLLLLARPVPRSDGFSRILNLFASDSIAQARADWRALQDADGFACNYWQQSERGGWRRQGG